MQGPLFYTNLKIAMRMFSSSKFPIKRYRDVSKGTIQLNSGQGRPCAVRPVPFAWQPSDRPKKKREEIINFLKAFKQTGAA